MFESTQSTPYIELRGDKMNLFCINLENSEISKKETHQSGESEMSKCFEDTFEAKNESQIFPEKKINFLGNKTKKFKSHKKSSGKVNKGKNKLIINLFNEFRSSNKQLYKEFVQFHGLEKQIKKEFYSTPDELARAIRDIFSQIFTNFHEHEKYNKTIIFSDLFEKIYKKYENKTLAKKCKALSEIINKLKKELRQVEYAQNTQNLNISNNSSNSSCFSPKNRFKLEVSDSFCEKSSEKSVKKFRNEIGEKIQKLNNEQKRGILGIISSNCVDKSIENNAMEINVNKMTSNQLKKLDQYINDCIRSNSSINDSPISEKKSFFSDNKLYADEKECDILKNDDLSSCLSDDDDDDEEE